MLEGQSIFELVVLFSNIEVLSEWLLKSEGFDKMEAKILSMWTRPTLALFRNSTRNFVHLGRNFVILWYDHVTPNPSYCKLLNP